MRPLNITLSILLLLPLSAVAATAQFHDVSPSDWYATYVNKGVDLGIVSGYKDANGEPLGEFRPANFVTLAEALKMAIEAESSTGIYQKKSCPEDCPLATDVHDWSAPYVQIAREWKFQIFDPGVQLDRPASRRQVAQIVADAFRIGGQDATALPQAAPFLDVPVTSKYAKAVDDLKGFDIITGDIGADGKATGYFRPVDVINRAEALKMIISAAEKFSELPAQNSDSTISFDGEGVFPFTFKYPNDVTWQQYKPDGVTADFQLQLHPKLDPQKVLVTIRGYAAANRPKDDGQLKPSFKTFSNDKYFVEIFTEDGQSNAAWQSVTSTFAFLP